jgi:beta-lactamase superfamily II metal-dependent hydrolase
MQKKTIDTIEPPAIDEVEVTVIGTGGGYGESILIHLSHKQWIVVDSCINPKTKQSLPLEYLDNLNVNIEEDVKLILCTHWHDDHILGVSNLLKRAKSAVFSITEAGDRKKFLQLIGLDFNKVKDIKDVSSTIELNECLDIMDKRGATVKLASQDKVLLSNKVQEVEYSVIALSPSDLVIQEFSEELSSLIDEYGKQNRKIVRNSPNDKSVVVYIKINDSRILLGSDLEVSENINKGWLCIMSNSQTIDKNKKAKIFKIPHHGSKNGYHTDIWSNLVEEKSIAKLTSWNRGSKLPEKEMLATYLTHTPLLYSTSRLPENPVKIVYNKPKKRNRTTDKTLKKLNTSVKEVPFVQGIIQSRTNISSMDNWQTVTYGEAFQVSNDDVK